MCGWKWHLFNNQQYLFFIWDVVAVITPHSSYTFKASSNTQITELKVSYLKIGSPCSSAAEDLSLVYLCN
jgi:hypothetical protein